MKNLYFTTFILLSFLGKNMQAAFTQMDLYANIETIGVIVSGTSLPTTATLEYKEAGGTWQTGHPLILIDGSRLAGSLFYLKANTSYEIKVTNGSDEITETVSTQVDNIVFTPSSIIYIDASASSATATVSGHTYTTTGVGDLIVSVTDGTITATCVVLLDSRE